MTDPMTTERWIAMSEAQRADYRTDNLLTPQLVGLEGWRVEAETSYGETRRFYVGRSTGWSPCHIEIKRRNSRGGMSADRQYNRITKLYRMGDTT